MCWKAPPSLLQAPTRKLVLQAKGSPKSSPHSLRASFPQQAKGWPGGRGTSTRYLLMPGAVMEKLSLQELVSSLSKCSCERGFTSAVGWVQV